MDLVSWEVPSWMFAAATGLLPNTQTFCNCGQLPSDIYDHPRHECSMRCTMEIPFLKKMLEHWGAWVVL